MKTIKKLCLIAIAILTSLNFSSCDDSNSSGSLLGNNNMLIGTWRSDFSSGYTLTTFNSDGTGTDKEIDYEEGVNASGYSHLSYFYYREDKDDSGNLVAIHFFDDEEQWSWKVISMTKTELIILNGDDYKEVYRKVQ